MVGIGEMANGISLAKEGHSIFKFFRKKGLKYFTEESLPIDWFKKQEVTIICSSLFAPLHNHDANYFSLVKPYSKDNIVPVGSGFFVTGIYDTLALSKLSIAFVEKGAVLSIGIDTIRDDIREDNLCLLGGPSSNIIGKEIYDDYLPQKHRFYSSDGGLSVHGNTFNGGQYGYILFITNPWNKSKKLLWLSGLGPFGTGAAVDFLINNFKDKAPNELTKENNWILFLQGAANQEGAITEINPIGHTIL